MVARASCCISAASTKLCRPLWEPECFWAFLGHNLSRDLRSHQFLAPTNIELSKQYGSYYTKMGRPPHLLMA